MNMIPGAELIVDGQAYGGNILGCIPNGASTEAESR
jgi:hypothetical protein